MRNRNIQQTFEEIGLLNEEELQRWSDEYGNGYGGYSADCILEYMIPRGYSMKFIKKLMGSSYLCFYSDEEADERFRQYLEDFKKTEIVEFEQVSCKTCGHRVKTIRRSYERVGKYFNEKGKLLEEYEFV